MSNVHDFMYEGERYRYHTTYDAIELEEGVFELLNYPHNLDVMSFSSFE